jgi:hypothetical protein
LWQGSIRDALMLQGMVCQISRFCVDSAESDWNRSVPRQVLSIFYKKIMGIGQVGQVTTESRSIQLGQGRVSRFLTWDWCRNSFVNEDEKSSQGIIILETYTNWGVLGENHQARVCGRRSRKYIVCYNDYLDCTWCIFTVKSPNMIFHSS